MASSNIISAFLVIRAPEFSEPRNVVEGVPDHPAEHGVLAEHVPLGLGEAVAFANVFRTRLSSAASSAAIEAFRSPSSMEVPVPGTTTEVLAEPVSFQSLLFPNRSFRIL